MYFRVSRFAAIFLIALPFGAAAAQDTPRKWWAADDVRLELGLTTQQSAQVEEIFQATLPKLRAAKQELDRYERDLSRLIADGTADESVVAQQIDRLEAARSNMSKMRTLMLFRMHRVLTPEQRAKLNALHERRSPGRDRDKDSGGRRR